MKLRDIVRSEQVTAAKPAEFTHEQHKAKQELHEKIAATKGIHPDVKKAALHVASFHEARNTPAKLAAFKRAKEKVQKEAADKENHEKMSKSLSSAIVNMRNHLVPHEHHVAHLKTLAKMVSKGNDSNYLSPEQINKIHEYIAKLPKVNPQIKNTLAKHMVNSAKNQIGKAARSNHWDHGLHAMYIADAADHLKIAHHLNKGENAKAGQVMHSMDTASRDEIPGKVWEHLNI